MDDSDDDNPPIPGSGAAALMIGAAALGGLLYFSRGNAAPTPVSERGRALPAQRPFREDYEQTTRAFFGLTSYNNEDIWQQAITPRWAGGTDACDLLALFGDAVLRMHVIDLLQGSNPRDTTAEIDTALRRFTTNSALARVNSTFRFDTFIEPFYQVQRLLSDKQIGTLVEALLGATQRRRGDEFAKVVVRRLMDIIEP
jgi:hypothetical protein